MTLRFVLSGKILMISDENTDVIFMIDKYRHGDEAYLVSKPNSLGRAPWAKRDILRNINDGN